MNASAETWHVLAWLGPVVVVAAAAITTALIVGLRPWLRRYALARPNVRSSHREPVPQGGGVAVIAATIAIVLLSTAALPQLGAGTAAQLAPLLAAAILVAAVGAVDDLRSLPVSVRLLFQALAVAIVIVALPLELRVVSWLPQWLERILLALGVLWFVNVVNFMDGIDWITVAEVVPITVGLVLLGAFGALPAHGVLVALALLGAILGFAPFNRPVAGLFLGDVGSLPIGLLLGWLLLLLAGSGHLVAAALMPLYYLADATITLLRRLVAGERVWQAHRSHFYQRAADAGFSVIAVDIRIFVVNLGLVALAAVTVLASSSVVDFGALALGGGLVAWLLVSFAKAGP